MGGVGTFILGPDSCHRGVSALRGARQLRTPRRHRLWIWIACIRYPILFIDPVMIDRLEEIRTELRERRSPAEAQGWIGNCKAST